MCVLRLRADSYVCVCVCVCAAETAAILKVEQCEFLLFKGGDGNLTVCIIVFFYKKHQI